MLVQRLDLQLQEAQGAMLAEMDELECVKAEHFLIQARSAAGAQWSFQY